MMLISHFYDNLRVAVSLSEAGIECLAQRTHHSLDQPPLGAGVLDVVESTVANDEVNMVDFPDLLFVSL